MSDYDRHVGSRIRLYRKHKNISAAEFAARIHKSVSAVSKYENGKISPDLNTLVDIAQALDVQVAQLMDFDIGVPGNDTGLLNNYLRGQQRLYFYYLYGKKGRIYRSILEIEDRREAIEVLLFCGNKDPENAYDCDYLYHGTLESSEANFYVTATNQNNSTEKIFLSVVVPFHAGEEAFGLFCALSQRNRLPVAYKTLFSRVPVREDDALRKRLLVSREEAANLRAYNDFAPSLYPAD